MSTMEQAANQLDQSIKKIGGEGCAFVGGVVCGQSERCDAKVFVSLDSSQTHFIIDLLHKNKQDS